MPPTTGPVAEELKAAGDEDQVKEFLEQVAKNCTIAALILETVPGSAGVYVPPAGNLRGARELCRRQGIMVIADEAMVGFGRTGAGRAGRRYVRAGRARRARV
ncbi:aminotransferase class III-fold pyridoxal phosphate-dependent enzyme [Micrococcus lylae]|uniref:aminotransferase class III-fold pyridoxal phosphate-dependent enzyme n=1 Tax=Micrococcus lylae TaxID=1273 RepID=UPI000C806BDC